MSAQGKQFKVNVSTPLGDAKTQTALYPGTMYIPESGNTIVFNNTIFNTLTEEEITALQLLLEEDTVNLGLPTFDGVVESATIIDSTSNEAFVGVYYIKSEKQFAAGHGFPGPDPVISGYHSTWIDKEGYYTNTYYRNPVNKLFLCKNKVYLVTSTGITEVGTSTGGGGGTNINTEATLEEAVAAGSDGVLYIPESEESLAIAFGGKSGYVISAGEKGYIKALLDKELLSKYTVSLTGTISHVLGGSARSNMPTTYLEYGVKNINPGSPMSVDGYQKLNLLLNVTYNSKSVDPTTNPTITLANSTSVYILNGNELTGSLSPASGSISMIKSTDTIGKYTLTLYLKDDLANNVNDSMFKGAASNVQYTEPVYEVALTKSANSIISCKKSKWIIDCYKGAYTIDTLKSLLENGKIYAAPFLIAGPSDPRGVTSGNHKCRRVASFANDKLGAGANIETFIISASAAENDDLADAKGNSLTGMSSTECTVKCLNGGTYKCYITQITPANDDSIVYIKKDF